MNREAARQQAFVEALLRPGQPADAVALGLTEQGARAAQGLGAYRANAAALAERALAAEFPTIEAMLGTDDFRHLARAHWREAPPAQGDLGEWGAALPEWIERHPGLADWPYLADCARVDLAVHRCERAADERFDAASLALLESTEPASLRLVLCAGTARVCSAWPVGAIHAAHRADAAPEVFDAAREAIAARRAQSVLVARAGWRAEVHALDSAESAFVAALIADANLADALDRAGAGLDFAGWLARALRGGWLARAAVAA